MSRFYTTSKFDREYIQNKSRYPKLEKKHVIENDSSRVRQKKSGELWSTVSLDPPKSTFFRETTFRPLGVLAPQIFTLARDWPRPASAHLKLWWSPPKNLRVNIWN